MYIYKRNGFIPFHMMNVDMTKMFAVPELQLSWKFDFLPSKKERREEKWERKRLSKQDDYFTTFYLHSFYLFIVQIWSLWEMLSVYYGVCYTYFHTCCCVLHTKMYIHKDILVIALMHKVHALLTQRVAHNSFSSLLFFNISC